MSISGYTKIAIGLALSLALVGCNNSVASDEDSSNASDNSEASSNSNDQLAGQWRVTDGSGETATFVFTPEGKLYILSDTNSETIELDYEKISDDPTLPQTTSINTPPSQESRIAKAKAAEARNYVGSMNRAQQAFYFENAAFTDDLQELAVGIESESQNYSYSIVVNQNGLVSNLAIAKDPTLRSYVGLVYQLEPGSPVTEVIICESDSATTEAPSLSTYDGNTEVNCPSGYSKF
ncbi:hypothetical protein Pse7367_0503 [Thalassoporum mexicanum PCC 7367]|uniref:type IV pilin-like G/H family protein n=1 Tax=Thalassoporum mexicanum TaxID=3457544 RepID=UPI00029FD60C|nr:type IV pilin-like G/H family protein [Pseudanabaena sp. PCC 7367]AFY68811.1 hypothetical protein Pse7367_0503 [Pseudanabaena sp. PCC 7367]